MKRADGSTIEAPDAFRAYRDNLRSNVLQVEQRRNDMRSILRSLTRAGIPSGDSTWRGTSRWPAPRTSPAA